jgi:predicted O-methyltransferase YrrM
MGLLKNAILTFKTEGGKSLIEKSSRFVLQLLYLPICFLKIRRFKTRNLNELVDFTSTVGFRLINPVQIREEILNLMKLLNKEKPKTILEIGTAKGGTLFLFSRVVSEDAILVSVDLPYISFNVGYHWWQRLLYKSFALPNQKIHLVRDDSHDIKTLEIVKNIFNGKKVDFLFIDGDHSYEGVKKDFEMYSSLVRKNGMIAFHDIAVHPGVIRFWSEIKLKYKYKEFVKNSNQYGIGVMKNAIIKKDAF